MKLNQILCPVDFSEFSQAANKYASALAASTGARIVYFYVSQPEVPYGSFAYENEVFDQKKIQHKLEEVKPTVEGVEASHVVDVGAPGDRIVHYANENNIDLIVMGTHGRTGLKRALMGSVAEQVVRKAACPVLALKADSSVLQPG